MMRPRCRFRFLGAATTLHSTLSAHHEPGQEHFPGTSTHLIQRTVLQGLHNDGRRCPAGSELGICNHVEDIVGVGFQVLDLQLSGVVIDSKLVFHIICS